MTKLTPSTRDQALWQARQDLAEASSLVRAAMERCRRDRRTLLVRFETAWEAVSLAEDDLCAILGSPSTALHPNQQGRLL